MPAPAEAVKLVELRDGTSIQANEHNLFLTIVALRGSVPQQWLSDFRGCIGKYCGLKLDQRAQLTDIWKDLPAAGKDRSAGAADIVTIGDAWLGPAIRAGYVQPIDGAEMFRWWRRMAPRWQQVVRRNPKTGGWDPHGKIYGAPYRWGATLVAYRREQLRIKGVPALRCWSDLLHPSLRGRIGFIDSTREFVGVALKTLGLSFNSSAQDIRRAGVTEQQLKDRVLLLRGQLKLLSSSEHIKAMAAGDVWVVVGYSNDLVLLGERSGDIEVIAPADGTALWADIWAVPWGAKGGHMGVGPSPLLPAWLEFGLQPERATTSTGLKYGAVPAMLPAAIPVAAGTSPASASAGLMAGDLKLAQANQYMPPSAVLGLSELLAPLDDETLELYRNVLRM